MLNCTFCFKYQQLLGFVPSKIPLMEINHMVCNSLTMPSECNKQKYSNQAAQAQGKTIQYF